MPEVTIEELLHPSYIDGLASMPLPEVRSRRDAAAEVETNLSYLRRLVQGRLDIVLAERRRREAGDEAGDLSDLVERLPGILSEHVRAPGFGRLPTVMAPANIDSALLDELDRVVPPDELSRLPSLRDEQLDHIAVGVEALERRISSERRMLFEVIDRLQEEIVRRYREGEATVDNLLR